MGTDLCGRNQNYRRIPLNQEMHHWAPLHESTFHITSNHVNQIISSENVNPINRIESFWYDDLWWFESYNSIRYDSMIDDQWSNMNPGWPWTPWAFLLPTQHQSAARGPQSFIWEKIKTEGLSSPKKNIISQGPKKKKLRLKPNPFSHSRMILSILQNTSAAPNKRKAIRCFPMRWP